VGLAAMLRRMHSFSSRFNSTSGSDIFYFTSCAERAGPAAGASLMPWMLLIFAGCSFHSSVLRLYNSAYTNKAAAQLGTDKGTSMLIE